MRVLLVTHRFPPDGIAGVERYTQTVAAELARAGDAVHIVTRRSPSPGASRPILRIAHEVLPGGTVVHRLVGGAPEPDALPVPTEGRDRLDRAFDAVLAEADPDVVHVNHLIDLSPRFIDLAHRAGAAVVISLHDFFFACPLAHLQKRSGALCAGPDGGLECARTCFAHEGEAAPLRWGLRSLLFRRLLAAAEGVVCPSRYVADYFAPYLPAPPDRLRVIPNGVAAPDGPPPLLEPFVPRGELREGPTTDGVRLGGAKGPRHPARTLRLATLGAVVPHKGPHLLIDALRLAALGPVELLVLGPTPEIPYVGELRAQAARVPGLELRLYGGYEPDELSLLLEGVDCVVTPSQVPETFSLTTREALVRGIPVVVSRLGALPEAIVEGVDGVAFAHDRPAELAAILRRLVDDGDLLPRLRAGAMASRPLSPGDHAVALRTVYAEAIAAVAGRGATHRGGSEELAFLDAALARLRV